MSVHRQIFTGAGEAVQIPPRRWMWAKLRKGSARAERSKFGVLRSGIMLMLAFPLAYATWTALVVAIPDATIAAIHLLFHGVVFPQPGTSVVSFSLMNFAIAAALWAAKGFVFGVVFAAVYNALERKAAPRTE